MQNYNEGTPCPDVVPPLLIPFPTTLPPPHLLPTPPPRALSTAEGTQTTLAPTPSNLISGDGTTPTPIKFYFSSNAKVILLQWVMEQNAHVALQKQLHSTFEGVLKMFIVNLSPLTWQTNTKPRVKTLHDKFCAMIKNRRDAVRKYKGASGISKEAGETNQL